uniref:PX domain-containing protein n=2 Tax=Aureoumbra lagunensis TaxID=44058 RepID=A0A7S3K4V4_9STRA
MTESPSPLLSVGFANDEERLHLRQYAVDIAEEELRQSLKEGLVQEIEKVAQEVVREMPIQQDISIQTSPDVDQDLTYSSIEESISLEESPEEQTAEPQLIADETPSVEEFKISESLLEKTVTESNASIQETNAIESTLEDSQCKSIEAVSVEQSQSKGPIVEEIQEKREEAPVVIQCNDMEDSMKKEPEENDNAILENSEECEEATQKILDKAPDSNIVVDEESKADTLNVENDELAQARRRREEFLARLETENSAELLEQRVAAARAKEIQVAEALAATTVTIKTEVRPSPEISSSQKKEEESDLFSIPNILKEDISESLFGEAQDEPLFGEAQVDVGALFGEESATQAIQEEALFGETSNTDDLLFGTAQTGVGYDELLFGKQTNKNEETKIDHPLFGDESSTTRFDEQINSTNQADTCTAANGHFDSEPDLFGFNTTTKNQVDEAHLFGDAGTSSTKIDDEPDLFGLYTRHTISTSEPDLFNLNSAVATTTNIRQESHYSNLTNTASSIRDDPLLFSDNFVPKVTPTQNSLSYLPQSTSGVQDNPFSAAAARARHPSFSLQETAIPQEKEEDDVFAPPPVGATQADPKAEWRVTRNDLALHRHELGKAAATYAFGGVFSCSMYGTAEAKDFETGEPYTEYIIRCQFGKTFETMKPWMVARRFREFVAVDANLRAALPDLAPHLPPLPSSFVFFAMSPQVVEQRQHGLEQYLKTLITEFPATLKSPQLDEFLCIHSRIAASTAPRSSTSNASATSSRGGFY